MIVQTGSLLVLMTKDVQIMSEDADLVIASRITHLKSVAQGAWDYWSQVESANPSARQVVAYLESIIGECRSFELTKQLLALSRQRIEETSSNLKSIISTGVEGDRVWATRLLEGLVGLREDATKAVALNDGRQARIRKDFSVGPDFRQELRTDDLYPLLIRWLGEERMRSVCGTLSAGVILELNDSVLFVPAGTVIGRDCCTFDFAAYQEALNGMLRGQRYRTFLDSPSPSVQNELGGTDDDIDDEVVVLADGTRTVSQSSAALMRMIDSHPGPDEQDDRSPDDYEGAADDVYEDAENYLEFNRALEEEAHDFEAVRRRFALGDKNVLAEFECKSFADGIDRLLLNQLQGCSQERPEYEETFDKLVNGNMPKAFAAGFASAVSRRAADLISMDSSMDRSPTILAYFKPLEGLMLSYFERLTRCILDKKSGTLSIAEIIDALIQVALILNKKQWPTERDVLDVQSQHFRERVGKISESITAWSEIKLKTELPEFRIYRGDDVEKFAWIAIGLDRARRIRNGFIHYDPVHPIASAEDVERLHCLLLESEVCFLEFVTREEVKSPGRSLRKILSEELLLQFELISFAPGVAMAIERNNSHNTSFDASMRDEECGSLFSGNIQVSLEFHGGDSTQKERVSTRWRVDLRGSALARVSRVRLCSDNCSSDCEPRSLRPHEILMDKSHLKLFGHIELCRSLGEDWMRHLPMIRPSPAMDEFVPGEPFECAIPKLSEPRSPE